MGRVSFLDPGAVEQDGDFVVVGCDFGDEGRDRVLGREVGGVDCCFAAQGLDRGLGLCVRCVALAGMLDQSTL